MNIKIDSSGWIKINNEVIAKDNPKKDIKKVGTYIEMI